MDRIREGVDSVLSGLTDRGDGAVNALAGQGEAALGEATTQGEAALGKATTQGEGVANDLVGEAQAGGPLDQMVGDAAQDPGGLVDAAGDLVRKVTGG